MRSVALMGILFIASAINAQKLSLTPQVGFENSRTSVDYNNSGSFVPIHGNFNPQVNLRLDYKFKQGFGAYIGAATSRSVVLYSFNEIDNGMNLYSSSRGNMQLRLEAGYLFTTNPIKFNKTKAASASPTTRSEKSSYDNYSYRGSCTRSYSSSRCQSKNSSARKAESKNNGGWVRLQPSVGLGFIPSPKTDIVSKTQVGETTYEYRAGNWNTALMTGMGFEFGRNKQRLVNVSVNYFKGIGNMSKQTITAVSGSKMSVANLESNASGWNMRIGIPFTLSGKSVSKNKTERTKRSDCTQKTITEYKYRCRMQ